MPCVKLWRSCQHNTVNLAIKSSFQQLRALSMATWSMSFSSSLTDPTSIWGPFFAQVLSATRRKARSPMPVFFASKTIERWIQPPGVVSPDARVVINNLASGYATRWHIYRGAITFWHRGTLWHIHTKNISLPYSNIHPKNIQYHKTWNDEKKSFSEIRTFHLDFIQFYNPICQVVCNIQCTDVSCF